MWPIRNRRQENQIHILKLFPGYAFSSSDQIDQLSQQLRGIPPMVRILATDVSGFLPPYDEEAEFLMNIMDTEHTVRLTYVAMDGNDPTTFLSGPLEKCADRI